jgi:Fe-S-cluster containining protein
MSDPGPGTQPAGWSDGLPPCTDCGHCCFFPDERYVMLFDEDLVRLGERAAELTHWIKGRCFLRMEAGHCIALRQDGERWLCSVYEIRPGLCREFERGCDTCRTVVQLRHPRAKRE